jgi:hypothetical protein
MVVVPLTGWLRPGVVPPAPSSKSAIKTSLASSMPRKKFMSTLLPSDSDVPLVTSGIAVVMPPLPVDTAVPTPSRRNQHSTVNCARSSAGGSPKVT